MYVISHSQYDCYLNKYFLKILHIAWFYKYTKNIKDVDDEWLRMMTLILYAIILKVSSFWFFTGDETTH